MRPMRSNADAMVAPVLPAEIMADAFPSRTASAARTSEESFIVRTLFAGSSAMPMTCDAGITSRPCSVPRSSGRPTSATGTPSSSAARRAPSMISPGALSPPMASTAMGSMGVLLDVDGLTAVVPAAVAAHDVGRLGRAAPGTHAAGRGFERPGRRPAAPALHLRGLLLGNGHSERTRLPVEPQFLQCGPPRVLGGLVVGVLAEHGMALGLGPRARLLAQRRQGQRQQQILPNHRLEVDAVTLEWIGLPLHRARVEDLLDVSCDDALDHAQASPALADPRRRDGALDGDGVVADRLDREAALDGCAGRQRGGADGDVVDVGGERDVSAGAGMAEELGDRDDERPGGQLWSWSKNACADSSSGSASTTGTSPLNGLPCNFDRPAATVLSVRSSTISKLASFWSQ